jgi:hypothetical protein
MMANADDERVMLALAALTYRGFHDVLGGRLHEGIVSGAVLDGLQTLAPVKDEWELVWGPATDRDRGRIVDSNAMYVVRSRRAPHRLVVAIRGTNPISLSDWVFGDFWVGEMVDWPYATADEPAAVSKSTALGLAALQAMRSRPPSARSASDVSTLVAGAFGTLARAARSDPGHLLAATPAWFESQVRKIAEHVQDVAAPAVSPKDRRRSALPVSIAPSDLRPRLEGEPRPDGDLDLLTFLRSEAGRTGAVPLEVVVTGHSKGGALAQAVAVWLKDALDSADPRECWDPGRRARVECYAFAGPTPGNTGFARRIARALGPHHHHLRNTNDLVTHAWQVDELRQIPALYGERTAVFDRLIALIADDVDRLDYRHAEPGVTKFSGELDTKRDFAHEFVYQHLDAYLARTELHRHGIRAATFFF